MEVVELQESKRCHSPGLIVAGGIEFPTKKLRSLRDLSRAVAEVEGDTMDTVGVKDFELLMTGFGVGTSGGVVVELHMKAYLLQ